MFSLLAVALLATADQVPAGLNENLADLKCVAALTRMNHEIDNQKDDSLTAIMLYFLGKIDGRTPGFDFGSAIEIVIADPLYNAEREALRCASEMVERGEALVEIGSATEPAVEQR